MTCEDRVAFVTRAAGNGMGRRIALTPACEGAKVVVNYRTSQDTAQAVVRHMESQGSEANACQADITHALLLAHPEAWKHGVTINVMASGPVEHVSSLDNAMEPCDHGPRWQNRE